MTKTLLLYVLATAAIILSGIIAAGAYDGRDETRNIERVRYDPSAERVFEGSVASRGHVIDGVTYFAIKISSRIVEVHIGPEEFVKRNGFKLKMGEVVRLAGMPLLWNGREIVLARQITTMTSVLNVRDRDGHPMWDRNRPVQMDPEVSEHLCELNES